jgi:hypothetical protein
MLLRSLSVYNFSPLRAIGGFTPRSCRVELCTQIKRDYLIEVIPLMVMDV